MNSPPRKSIAQFARSHGLDVKAVGKEAGRVLGLTTREARNANHLLDPAQCARLVEALGIAPEADPAPEETSAEPAAPETTLPASRPDPTTPAEALRFEGLGRSLHVHPDVFDDVQRDRASSARLSLMLQQLGAHGRTAAVKGCKGQANQGWLRSPFGGHGGRQFYLWWAQQGAPPVKEMALASGAIVVRAIRHHDDHDTLVAGELDDYLHLGPKEVEDADLVAPPWTPAQVAFVEAADPIRFVLGRPGSGKTTVLWKAIEARADQRVLYLTWSRDLTRTAVERFRAFAPAGVEVRPHDFVSFLGELCGADLRRVTLAESRRLFTEALAQLNGPGPMQWRGREIPLHAEMRAFLIGRAIPGGDDAALDFGLCHLTRDVYLKARAGEFGRSSAIGVLDAFDALGRLGVLGDIFPELVAAREAIERLRAHGLPSGFERFDRIVVDEVQDLTLIDAAVIVELCLAIARARGAAPWLLVAGDDGQTVRPSAFEWGRLADLVTGALGKPKKFQLDENLRCPARIAAVIERASAHYGQLSKEMRPTKQSTRGGGEHTEAHLFHVDNATVEEAIELLDEFEDSEGVVVLAPSSDLPAWLPERLHDMVLTPADAKGLEYQSVVLLDPGRQMTRLQPPSRGMGWTGAEHAARTAIDQFRVALSRATETLVFVDVQAGDEEQALSRALLGDAAPYDPADLVEHFADADVTVEERLSARMNDARALIDERPRRAWRRAVQAVRLLGDPALPNGVSSPTLRTEAHMTLVATAARRVVDEREDTRSLSHDEVVSLATASLECGPSALAHHAFLKLVAWTRAPAGCAIEMFELLEYAVSLEEDDEWLRAALVPVSQALRMQLDASARDATHARRLRGYVESWLGLLGYPGDVDAEARRLRVDAFDTLLSAMNLDEAEAILGVLEPPDHLRSGRLAERQGRHAAAGEAFERVGALEEALFNWREAGDWDRALALLDVDAPERDDLQWLVDFEALIAARPPEHIRRLTPAETGRMRKLFGPTDVRSSEGIRLAIPEVPKGRNR